MNKNLLKGMVLGIALTITGVSVYNAFSLHLGKSKINIVEKMERINDILDDYFMEDVNYEDLENAMLHGYINGLGDPYTTYLDKEEFEIFMENSNGTYFGIGASITADEIDNTVMIVIPFEGSPSYEAGLRPGDKIIKVDGDEVFGNRTNEALSKIKGPKGTEVLLSILKANSGIMEDVLLVRDEIILPTVAHKKLEGNIGYIRLTGFDRVTTDQFNIAYDELLNEGIEGLILDLRNNPGGLLNVVGDITNRLIPEGVITYTENKNGERRYINSDDEEIEIPLVILINGHSASASEVLSGAVQDTGKGVLIGEQSFGKGLVQSLFKIGDGTALKVTIEKYYTPNGICIQGEGLTPDIVVEMDEEAYFNLGELTREEDKQLVKAIEYINSKK